MAAPQKRTPSHRALRLPELTEHHTPAWRIAQHAMGTTLALLVLVTIAIAIVGNVVKVRITVDGTGTLEPTTVWPVRAPEAGVVSAVTVRTGDTVRIGQPVARFDSTETALSVAQLEAQFASARSAVERARRGAPIDSERLAALEAVAEASVIRARAAMRSRMIDFRVSGDPDSVAHASNSRVHVGLDAPAADLLTAIAQLRVARSESARGSLSDIDIAQQEAEVRRLSAALSAARHTLHHLAVSAPANGVVLTDQVEQLVGTAARQGDPLFDVGDISGWRVNLSVTETDVHRIHVGDTVTIEIPALKSADVNTLRALVVTISQESATPTSSGAGSAGGFHVVAVLTTSEADKNSGTLLRRGYAVRAKIVTRSARLFTAIRNYFQ